MLEGVTFIATPGYNYTLSYSSEGIDPTKPANQEYIKQLNSFNSFIADTTTSSVSSNSSDIEFTV